MAPIDDTETDEETVALRKKRSRRVSFADVEITSIHIFNRDDEDDTPPTSSSAKRKSVSDADEEVLQFFRDHADSEEVSTPCEVGDDDDDVRKSFFRPVGSPSPGSSSAPGSSTYNDEDDFFGPVAADFIRPRKLSDSGASDDNHDLTMDSTAFSLHYRSLARSDSGELRTPTKVSLALDEKTPSHVGTDSGSFMMLKRAKKSNSESPSVVEKSDGRDSNDMSLVGEHMRSYDYGRLSPKLEALLAGGSKDIDGSSVLDHQNVETDSVVGMPVQMNEANLADNTMKLTPKSQSNVWNPNPNHMGMVQSPNQLRNVNDNCIEAVIGTNMQENIGTPKATGKVVQFDALTGQESGQLPTVGWIKDNLHDETDHDPRKHYKSPLSGAMSLLSTKRQKTFADAADYGQLLQMTPSLNQASSSHLKNVNVDGIVSSAHRSNSKFKIFEPSPLASSVRVGIERSRDRLSKFRSSAKSPAAAIVSENHEDGKVRHVTIPIINLEKHLFSVDAESKHPNTRSSTVGHDVETPKNIECLSKNEGTMDLSHQQDSLMQMLDDAQLTIQVSSPSQLTWLQNEAGQQLLMSGSDSAKVQLNVENRNGMNFSDAPENLGSSMNDDLQSSPRNVQTHSAEIKQQVLYGLHSATHSEENRNPIDDVTGSNNSMRNLTSNFSENREQHLPEKTVNVQTSLREGNTQNLHSETSNGISVTSDLFHQSKAEFHAKSIGAFCDSADKSTSKLPFMTVSSKQESTQSPKAKSDENNVEAFAAEEILVANSNSKGHGNNDRKIQIHDSKRQFLVQDINSFRNGGGNILDHEYGNYTDEISTLNRRPNIRGTQESDVGSNLECSNSSTSDKKTIDCAPKHWKDVSQKFCEEANQMLSPRIDKLRIGELNELQDILFQQQKVQIFDILRSQFHSQKIDDLSEVTNKRMAEAGSLLFKLAYEKARVQLMSLKREKIMSREQQLSSAVQETQMLKSNCIYQPWFPVDEKDASVDNIQNSCINLERQCEVPSEKLLTHRHENEALHRKINNLTKSFHSRFKMKGEPSCSETIALLDDHLKRRISFRFIRDEMQLREIVDLGSSNDQQNIVLNYQGFVCQRLVISSTSHSMSISNTLNVETANKNFPNMDANVAFSFVLTAGTTAKYHGSKCLAQRTQVTHMLLNNLLDVIKEVQLSQVEIRSLVHATFHSPSAEQLDLQLSFVDFNSSRKLILKLDMTSLRCGHYPSDIVPYQLQSSGTPKLQHESLANRLEAAISSVGDGHFRIIRLCRSVAQVLQSAST